MELLSRFKSDEDDLASTEEEDGKRHSRWPYGWPEDLQDLIRVLKEDVQSLFKDKDSE